MSDAIIVLNGCSSRLGFSIFQIADGDVEVVLVARGRIERTGASMRFFAQDRKARVIADVNLAGAADEFDHAEAFAQLTRWISTQFDTLSPVAVGQHVAHGGVEFTHAVAVSEEVIEQLDRLVPLAPEHQPHNLAAIRAVAEARPDLTQVACFDTTFHRDRSIVTERFALPEELFQRGIRRWGFHGLAYASVVDEIHELAPDLAGGRFIIAHLSSCGGADMCAVSDGRCVDTTMGFSSLDGLPTATRCGSIDPGVVLFLIQSAGLEHVKTLLSSKAGLLGISGISGDLRELLASASPRAAEAVEFFVYRAVREIGSLTATLRGLDGLIFTADIGENSPAIRSRICDGLGWLGLAVDRSANEQGRGCISPLGQSPSVWVIPSNEERLIASSTLALTAVSTRHRTRSLSARSN